MSVDPAADRVASLRKRTAELEGQSRRLEAQLSALEERLENGNDSGASRRHAEVTAALATLNAELHGITEELIRDDAATGAAAIAGALIAANEATDRRTQLTALLLAWRGLRDPLLAEVIDHVSEELTSTLPAIDAAQVPDLCANRDPADVGRILAAPWPDPAEYRAHEQALPQLQAILQLPDDPRVAAALTRQLDLNLYGVRPEALREFYLPLHTRLNELGDVRQLALLEAVRLRTGRDHLLDARTVAVHRKLTVPPTTAANEQAIAELQRGWAGSAERKKKATRSKAEWLADILANPSDLTSRGVYGDFLSEQGDPRGELIGLQLGPPGPESLDRQLALIDQHWREWVGPISEFLRVPPRFEAGFPVEGEFHVPPKAAPRFRELLDEPAWRTFRKLSGDLGKITADVIQHPNLCSLRVFHRVQPSQLKKLVGAALTEIAVFQTIAPLKPGAFGRLPSLKRLVLELRDYENVSPVIEKLEILCLKDLERTYAPRRDPDPPRFEFDAPALEAALSSAEHSPIRMLEIAFRGGTDDLVRLERGEPRGPFTRLVCLSNHPDLLPLLAVLPTTLTSITYETVRPVPLGQSPAAITALTARFRALTTCELPFIPRLPAPHVRLSFNGVSLLDEELIPALWTVLTRDLGVSFTHHCYTTLSNVYFQARHLLFELERSKKRGIAVDPEQASEARRVQTRMLRVSVGLHVGSAALLAFCAGLYGEPLGYAFAGLFLLSTFFRPGLEYYRYLRARLRTHGCKAKLETEARAAAVSGENLYLALLITLPELDLEGHGQCPSSLSGKDAYVLWLDVTPKSKKERRRLGPRVAGRERPGGGRHLTRAATSHLAESRSVPAATCTTVRLR